MDLDVQMACIRICDKLRDELQEAQELAHTSDEIMHLPGKDYITEKIREDILPVLRKHNNARIISDQEKIEIFNEIAESYRDYYNYLNDDTIDDSFDVCTFYDQESDIYCILNYEDMKLHFSSIDNLTMEILKDYKNKINTPYLSVKAISI